jgi:hypothetical protein
VALRRFYDALGAVFLVAAAALGEATINDKSVRVTLLFLLSAVVGVAAGWRVAHAAFRWGRRRRRGGEEPEPAEGPARVIGGFIGFWIKLILGFLLWALLLQFFRQ